MYNKLTLFFLLFLFHSTLSAQTNTSNVFIDVGGSRSTSGICSAATVGMSGAADVDGEGDNITATGLEFGPYNFNDPVPPGNKITNVEVVFHNSACNQTINVDIASAMIMGIMTMGDCTGNVACPTSNNRGNIPVDFGCDTSTEYNYGGINQFDAMLINAGMFDVVTFTHAELIFTYESCSSPIEDSIPTMSEWGLIIFGLLTVNLGLVLLRRKEEILA